MSLCLSGRIFTQRDASQLSVVLLTFSACSTGRDQPFVNNYGVWTDEYTDLGLGDTLNAKWEDAVCYFGEGQEVRVGRRWA